jgi:hypothetical protein
MKDIYADDITLSVTPPEKLVSFFESELARAVSTRSDPSPWPDSRRVTTGSDPEITAVNAAFALGLVERHDVVDESHRLYDLAHAAADDAPGVDLDAFKRRFRSLGADPSASDYRKTLVDATRAYVVDSGGAVAAD